MSKQILFVKLSSLGDVINSFAAVDEMKKFDASLEITWAVEEAFVNTVLINKNVSNVISVPLRRLRKQSKYFWWRLPEWKEFIKKLQMKKFDLVIDAQGLIKSSLIASKTGSCVVGYDKFSAREKLSSYFYHRKINVSKELHAINRTRQLCAYALNYDTNIEQIPEFSLAEWRKTATNKLFFFHGTTWSSKLLPLAVWENLAQKAIAEGFEVNLIWGNNVEQLFCQIFKQRIPEVNIANRRYEISELIEKLMQSSGVISVDTGLGHLSAQMGVPTLGLFAASNYRTNGLMGKRSNNISSETYCSKRDCRKHGASTANACMENRFINQEDEIWNDFKSLLLLD